MTALALVKDTQYSQEAYSDSIETPFGSIPRRFDEFWTAKQRQMNSLHYSNSYRGTPFSSASWIIGRGSSPRRCRR